MRPGEGNRSNATVNGATTTTTPATAGPSSPITQMPTAAASSTGASFRPMPMALRAGSLNSIPFRQQRLWTAFTKKSEYLNTPGPPVHDDLVARVFPAGSPAQIWVADITEHPTREGKRSRCTAVPAPTGTPSHSTTRRARGKHAGSIDGVVTANGGIMPAERRHSSRLLRLAEQTEISRGCGSSRHVARLV
jgi:hypothetical protein